MSKSLVDALGMQPWSVSSVMFDLNDMLDDEGRPLSERRADAPVRAAVEMEMRLCPYSGVRNGKWMNMSALTQISQHYNAVMDEVAAMRRQVDGSWDGILAVVLDQLARPALHLLQQRDAQGPVPAQAAVGHKLAAGFFGVMRTLHERLALGMDLPVSVEGFLELVEQTGALVGANEACAGSPQMIRKASTTLIEGEARKAVTLAPQRLEMARCLALQVQLGIFWYHYDRQHLWELLRGQTRQSLRPCNDFLNRKLERAAAELPQEMPARAVATRLPQALESGARYRLADALRDAASPDALAKDLETAAGLLRQPGSVIAYEGRVESFALRVARYLNAHRLFSQELERLEQRLRTLLDLQSPAPVRLGGTVLPLPQALAWIEMVVGRRLGEGGHLTGSSTGIRTRAA